MPKQSFCSDDRDGASAAPAPPPVRRLQIVRILTIIALIGAVGASIYFRDHLQELKRYGYGAVFLVGLVSNATLILPVPGLAVSSLMGGVFNPWIVGILGGVGQAIGELTGYMAGYSGHTLIDEGPIYHRLNQWMQRYGALAVFFLALIPNPVFDVGGMIAGALRLPLWQFLVSCTAGKVLKNIFFALAGYYGIEAIFKLLE